jgi:hypothetical protein
VSLVRHAGGGQVPPSLFAGIRAETMSQYVCGGAPASISYILPDAASFLVVNPATGTTSVIQATFTTAARDNDCATLTMPVGGGTSGVVRSIGTVQPPTAPDGESYGMKGCESCLR